MRVVYCDLCGTPIRGKKYVQILCECNENPQDSEVKNSLVQNSEAKEICEKCREILLKIFELRFVDGCKLTEELQRLYNLPAKREEHKAHTKGKKK